MKAETEQHQDRYAGIARVLRVAGWLQDLLLQHARQRAVDILRADGATCVLDACCGSGTLSQYLSEAGMEVLGVDLSPSMLALARKRAPKVEFIEADLSQLELEKKVDGAVIALAIHEMPEPVRIQVWAGLRRLTQRDAPLIVIDYAVLESTGWLSRLAAKIIAEDERYVGKLDPGHFENFEDFQARGGTRAWLASQGETVVNETRFLFGNLSVSVVRG